MTKCGAPCAFDRDVSPCHLDAGHGQPHAHRCGARCPFDHAGTPCVKEAWHDGLHSWPTEIEMEGTLPTCRLCGKKAARCPCPPYDAHGRLTVEPVPEPEVTAADAARLALNLRVGHGAPETDATLPVPTLGSDGKPLPPWHPGVPRVPVPRPEAAIHVSNHRSVTPDERNHDR